MKLLVIENPRPLTIEHYNDVANAPLSACLNSGYALAVARLAGWEAAHLDLTACRDHETVIADLILAENADLILFHWVYSWGNEEIVRAILDILVTSHHGAIGAFGLFPTLAHQRLTNYAPQLDFLLIGEFEATLEELLLNYRHNTAIPVLAGLFNGKDRHTRRELITDLSQLPIPDDVGTNCHYPTMNIAASRGCFGDCSFCFIRPFYGCSQRRERSSTSFVRELEYRLERREVKNIYFIDPTFIGYDENKGGRAREISSILKSNSLPFGFETRVDTLDQELINTLVKNGATSVFLGIESGCDAALQRINKRITQKQIIQAVRAVQNSGILLSVGFIMFEPDSTLDELFENYSLLEELGLLSCHDQTVNLLYHSQIVLYGTRAWDKFADSGRLLLDERLPFEANYRFKDERVELVCRAMRRLSSEYFTRIAPPHLQTGTADNGHGSDRQFRNRSEIDGDALNLILKEAFLAFIKQAGNGDAKQFNTLEQLFSDDMRSCL